MEIFQKQNKKSPENRTPIRSSSPTTGCIKIITAKRYMPVFIAALCTTANI
jgi:hypothetical protein